jgi:hypothetical protein
MVNVNRPEVVRLLVFSNHRPIVIHNLEYLEKMLPWAVGMSYRNQPTEELTVKNDQTEQGCRIQRMAILQRKQLLKNYLEI